MSQYKGVVQWFNNAEGYGFLGREEGPDVFVQLDFIQRDGFKSLKKNDGVTGDVVDGDKGLQDDHVDRVKE